MLNEKHKSRCQVSRITLISELHLMPRTKEQNLRRNCILYAMKIYLAPNISLITRKNIVMSSQHYSQMWRSLSDMFLSKCKRGACDSATSFSKLGGESPSLGPCIPLGKENMPLGMSARLVKCNFVQQD